MRLGKYECETFGLRYFHWCPGCKVIHAINVTKPNSQNAVWEFNGDMDSPTFSPSVNIVGKCHYFIREGQIEYLLDSKHSFAGKTVPIPEIPKGEWE